MQLGIFLPNANNGYLVSEAAPQYMPTYELNKEITLEAERVGLDFVLSMVKHRGFGGSTEFWDYHLDSYTLTAGLAEATERIRIFASVGILSHHPAMSARIMAGLDELSGGRVGLNIVTGGWKPEYTQLGVWPGDRYYEERYDYARDYVETLRALWDEGTVTRKGRVFELEDCRVWPRPEHRIPLVNAGQSPKGMAFTAELCDYSFLFSPPERLGEYARTLRALAAERKRTVGTFGLFHLIPADTDKEAHAIVRELVERADEAALDEMVRIQTEDAKNEGSGKFFREGRAYPPEVGNPIFMGFPVIAGSWETCRRRIDEIAGDTGIDGMMLMFLDFVQGIRDFGERILPGLEFRQAQRSLA